MEVVAVLMVLGLIGIAMVGWILGLVAWTRTRRLEERIDALARDLDAWRKRPSEPARSWVAPETPPVEPVTTVRVERPPMSPPAEPLRPRAAVPPPPPPRPSADPLLPRPPRPFVPPPPAPPDEDFATTIGPRILVATGALAFMVFLGLFAKYAWDNNWVGPAGRILIGAVTGIALLALGIRLMHREYRPLGQGLAAAGLAGLYTSAFAAHGLYDLVPREVSALLMIAVTVSAVLLALRLDARLLAMLAWTGGYMTPLLLSTGEDRAVALFLFLALLDAGALLIDNRKPWPETAPLAMTGTVLLYGGWYERFFRPERFEVAAAGLVLFTALFAIGMARKQRSAALGIVIAAAGIGIAVMAGDTDRPIPLLVLSMALAAFALRASVDLGRGLATIALGAAGLPFLVWWASHYHTESFGIAALWVLGMALLFILPAFRRAAASGESDSPGIELTVLALAGIASAALCATTDRPLPVGGFLAAMAALAVLVRGRWREAELLGILTTALSVALWMGRFFGPARAGDAYAVALPAAAVFALSLLVRGLIARQALASVDVVAHLGFAGLTWWFFYAVLDASHPALKGPVAAGMAAAYLVIGMAALRQSPRDQRLIQVALGLASAFLTLAIPIQLGLHGVTLAWAAEGVLLLALGARFASAQGRAAGYVVLALAAAHVVGANQPLHPGAFRPVLNPVFGTWLAVIAAFGAALLVTRSYRESGHPLDSMAGPIAGTIAILLLFGVLNAETRATFAQRQLEAERLGDLAASQAARRISGLAISVLWTVFATGLLAAGLAARSRALFYAAYALFAVTAVKVVLSDLEDFSVPYRMFAFLALGLLLMAGAYLNLRFRQRLMPASTS
jgi:uncharacterized membrane protein